LFLTSLHLEFLHGTPPRIDLSGASYRMTSHGDRRNPNSVGDVDRESLIALLATGTSRAAHTAVLPVAGFAMTVNDCKNQHKIRFYGASCKTPAAPVAAPQHSLSGSDFSYARSRSGRVANLMA